LIAGPDSQIGRLMALTAGFILAMHLIVGLALSTTNLVREARS
jgi:hypothetical protein